MLKESIAYTDFNGEERTEEFYFNLTKAELVELETSMHDGLSEAIKRIVAEDNQENIVKIFKEIILKAYGVKSIDGRRFVKNQEIRDDFAASEPYSVLFMKLATDTEAATAFINGIVPTDLNKTATANAANGNVTPITTAPNN